MFCKPRGKIVPPSASSTRVQGLSRPGFTDTRRHAPTNERDLHGTCTSVRFVPLATRGADTFFVFSFEVL